VIKTWLRRFLGLTALPLHEPEAKQALERRLDQLDERLDFHAAMIKRLRGRITGGLRGDPDDKPGDGEVAAPKGNPQALELLRKHGKIA